jgi:hypothetical protein
MEIIRDIISANNFAKGRKGWIPDRIVIHVTEGSEQAAESWFDAEESDVSAHFIISKKGVIKQEVELEDSAWAQGRVFEPTAKIVIERQNVNPNLYCISIEHEGDGNEPLTPEQKIASVWLIRYLVGKYPKILYDRDHILKHHEIYAKKTCPGKIDVDELVRLAAVKESIMVGKVVWSNFLDSYIIVTRYTNDNNWSFKILQPVGADLVAQIISVSKAATAGVFSERSERAVDSLGIPAKRESLWNTFINDSINNRRNNIPIAS